MQGSFGISKVVTRAASTLPQTTATNYFTVTGRVLVYDIIGEVTVEIGAGANNMKLTANPTVGADVDICAAADIDTDAVGTLYTITGTLANALVPTTSGAVQSQINGILVTAGKIDLACDASKAGQTKWLIRYVPLDPGSNIVAA